MPSSPGGRAGRRREQSRASRRCKRRCIPTCIDRVGAGYYQVFPLQHSHMLSLRCPCPLTSNKLLLIASRTSRAKGKHCLRRRRCDEHIEVVRRRALVHAKLLARWCALCNDDPAAMHGSFHTTARCHGMRKRRHSLRHEERPPVNVLPSPRPGQCNLSRRPRKHDDPELVVRLYAHNMVRHMDSHITRRSRARRQ